MKEPIRILLTGGSTGGHLYPLIAVAEDLIWLANEHNLQLEFIYLGAEPLERESLKKIKAKIISFKASKIRRYFDWRNLLDALKFPFNFLKVFWLIFKYMPDVIFSKGGPGSLEVVIAGWLLRIPILIHESDAVPGRSNLIAKKFATRIATAFENALKYFPKEKTALVGQPIRRAYREINFTEEEIRKLDLPTEGFKFLILGGSQGSQFINEFILEVLPDLLKLGAVIHQCGRDNYQEVKQLADFIILKNCPMRDRFYKLYPFLDEVLLFKFLNFVDLVISRAGAGAIFEISATGKPSVLIPIPSYIAGEHQLQNAIEYSRTGAAIVIEQENLKPKIFMTVINKLVANQAVIDQMKKSATEFAKPDASYYLAKELLHLAGFKI